MYVVAGVSGNTGKVAAETLLGQGARVRVLVRDAQKGEPWRARGAEVALAGLDDERALGAALTGASGAYLLLPPNYASSALLSDNEARTRVLGAAIAASGVPHVVLLSSIGAQHATGNGPIASLHVAERELPKAAPKARFTFVRAAYFAENVGSVLGVAKADGVLPAMFDPTARIPMVATADIGRVAARALVEGPPASATSVIELAGPRETSFDELAAAAGAALGKDVRAVHVPRAAVKGALVSAGLSDDLAGLYDEMTAGIDAGIVAFEGGAARHVRGAVDPRDVVRALLG